MNHGKVTHPNTWGREEFSSRYENSMKERSVSLTISSVLELIEMMCILISSEAYRPPYFASFTKVDQ